MKSSLLPTLAVGLILSGCSVMHFQNGPVEPAGRPIEKWHHNVAYSLIELGAPLDVKTLCPESGKWSMITTKETLVTGIAGSIDDALTSSLTGGLGGVDIWNPQMVEYTCGK